MHISKYLHRRSHTLPCLMSPVSTMVMEAGVGYRRSLCYETQVFWERHHTVKLEI